MIIRPMEPEDADSVAQIEKDSFTQPWSRQGFLDAMRLPENIMLVARGFAWLDTGTHDSLSEASTFIEVLEKRQGLKVACLEGIAYRQGWITAEQLRENAQPMLKNDYGKYLLSILEEKNQTLKKNLEY